jgi:hypothetical protein
MDKKYITSTGIALIIGFMAALGVDVVDNDEGYLPYTCDLDNVEDRMCYKLSRVGSTGVNRNCYYDRDRPAKYKVCSAGWKRLINIDDYEADCPDVLVIAYVDDGFGGVDKYFCDGIGPEANCVMDGTLEMPFV